MPQNLKQHVSDVDNPIPRKKVRPSHVVTNSCTQDMQSKVISSENMTSVERHTSSGRKLKIVCYRRFNNGEIDRNGNVTLLSPRFHSESPPNSSPPKSPHHKSQTITSPSVNKSPNEKLESIKKIGRLRALKDNEINDLLSTNSENEESSDSEEEDQPFQLKADRKLASPHIRHSANQRKIEKDVEYLDSIQDSPLPDLRATKKTKTSRSESKSKNQKKNEAHLSGIKNLPLPDYVTPKKDKHTKPKSKSTTKKSFICRSSNEPFSTCAELRDHEEEQECIQPVSKTSSRYSLWKLVCLLPSFPHSLTLFDAHTQPLSLSQSHRTYGECHVLALPIGKMST